MSCVELARSYVPQYVIEPCVGATCEYLMKRKTKRTLVSLAGGVLVPILAFEVGSFARGFASLRGLADVLFWLAGWPLALLKPITPDSEDPSAAARNLRLMILLAAPALDVFGYA